MRTEDPSDFNKVLEAELLNLNWSGYLTFITSVVPLSNGANSGTQNSNSILFAIFHNINYISR